MSALTNRFFRNVVAAPALALAAVSLPFAGAVAQDRTVAAQPVAANANVQVQPVAFSTFNDSNRSVRFVQAGAAEASVDRIAIVVWGGNRELQQQAYNAALDLRDQGIPLAFILGPDLNGLSGDAQFDIYANGAPAFERPGRMGVDNADLVRADLVQAGRRAYQMAFPREMAALALR